MRRLRRSVSALVIVEAIALHACAHRAANVTSEHGASWPREAPGEGANAEEESAAAVGADEDREEALSLQSHLADAEAALAARANGVDPEVTYVETAGAWESGGTWGRVRLVVLTSCGPEHCYDEAFVQWVTSGETPAVRAQARLELPVGSIVGADVSPSRRRNGLIEVEVQEADEGSHGRWCIDASRVGAAPAEPGRCRPNVPVSP